MSPLAPQMNGNHRFNRDTDNPRSLIDPMHSNNEQKFVYSLGDLYGMRHSQMRVPNLGNRNVLSSISRPNPVPNTNFPSMFSFNIMSSALGQIHGDRRTQNQPRIAPRHQNRYNGGHMNNGPMNVERQRQPNRGKTESHDLKLFFSLFIPIFFWLCSHNDHVFFFPTI